MSGIPNVEAVRKTSRRPSAFRAAWGTPRWLRPSGPPLPNRAHGLHVPFGEVCQICQIPACSASAKISSRPSAFSSTTKSGSTFVLGAIPSEAHEFQFIPGVVCWICQSAPAESRAKTSRRPSMFRATLGLAPHFTAGGLPNEVQLVTIRISFLQFLHISRYHTVYCTYTLPLYVFLYSTIEHTCHPERSEGSLAGQSTLRIPWELEVASGVVRDHPSWP